MLVILYKRLKTERNKYTITKVELIDKFVTLCTPSLNKDLLYAENNISTSAADGNDVADVEIENKGQVGSGKITI